MDNSDIVENMLYKKFTSYAGQKDMEVEAKLGRIIPKHEIITQLLQNVGQGSEVLNDNQAIQKQQYRFESQVNEIQFKNALNEYQSDFQNDDWDYLIDFPFDQENYSKISVRIGIDDKDKLYAYEKSKRLDAKHVDVIDQGRILRFTFSENQTEDQDNQIILNNLKQRDPQKISAVRLKQSKIFMKEEIRYTFSKVQQIFQKEMIMELYELLEDGITKAAVKNIFTKMQEKSNYYKYQYEIEIEIKLSEHNQDNQTRKKRSEKFLKNIRILHDHVTTQESKKFQEQLDKKKEQKKQKNSWNKRY